jgi:ribosomal protein L16/L10AE
VQLHTLLQPQIDPVNRCADDRFARVDRAFQPQAIDARDLEAARVAAAERLRPLA